MLFDIFLFVVAVILCIIMFFMHELVSGAIFFLAIVLVYVFTTVSDLVENFEDEEDDE